MKVLLVHPSIEFSQGFANYPSFSDLGMLYLASYLRKNGLSVSVADALCPNQGEFPATSTRRGWRLGLDGTEFEEMLRVEADAVVLVSSLYSTPAAYNRTTLPAAVEAVRRLHPRIPLVLAEAYVGGVDHLPFDPVSLLEIEPELDFVVPGEAEASVTALLLETLGNHGPVPPGTAYRQRGGPRLSPGEQPLVKDLDAVPPPAFDLVGGRRYLLMQARAARLDLVHEHPEPRLYMPIMSSRGCPYSCSFCAGGFKKRFRAHSLRYMAEEILPLARRLGAEVFLFLDDCANADPKRFDAILELFEHSGMDLDFMNGLRADKLSDATLERLKRAGALKLTVSMESAVQDVLDHEIGKGLSPGQVNHVLAQASKLGLRTQAHYIIGFPKEKPAQVNETLSFAMKCFAEYGTKPLVQFATPIPGTRLYQETVTRGMLAEDIEGADLLSLFQDRSVIRGDHLDPVVLARFRNCFEKALTLHQDDALMLEVTRACNNACSFCSLPGRSKVMPMIQDLVQGLEQGLALGKVKLELDGGEPTMRDDLPDIVFTAKDLGYSEVTLVTNARRLSYKPYALALARAGLDRILVSVPCAAPSVHDEITKVAGSFEQTAAGIVNALESGIRHVGINTIVARETLEFLPSTVAWAKRTGAEILTVQYCIPMGSARRNGSSPSWMEALPHLVEAMEVVGEGGDLRAVLQNVPQCLVDLETSLTGIEVDNAPRHRARWTVSGKLVDFHTLIAGRFGRIPACKSCPQMLCCRGMLEILEPGR